MTMPKAQKKSNEEYKVSLKFSVQEAKNLWKKLQMVGKGNILAEMISGLLRKKTLKQYLLETKNNIHNQKIAKKGGYEAYIEDLANDNIDLNNLKLIIECPWKVPREAKQAWAKIAIRHFTKRLKKGEKNGVAIKRKLWKRIVRLEYRRCMSMTVKELNNLIATVASKNDLVNERLASRADKANFLVRMYFEKSGTVLSPALVKKYAYLKSVSNKKTNTSLNIKYNSSVAK